VGLAGGLFSRAELKPMGSSEDSLHLTSFLARICSVVSMMGSSANVKWRTVGSAQGRGAGKLSKLFEPKSKEPLLELSVEGAATIADTPCSYDVGFSRVCSEVDTKRALIGCFAKVDLPRISWLVMYWHHRL
jgi:hypothetical protein